MHLYVFTSMRDNRIRALNFNAFMVCAATLILSSIINHATLLYFTDGLYALMGLISIYIFLRNTNFDIIFAILCVITTNLLLTNEINSFIRKFGYVPTNLQLVVYI